MKHQDKGTMLFALIVAVLAGPVVAQNPPICAELVETGYGFMGDTLYPGTPSEVIIDGYVTDTIAHLEIISGCVADDAQYKFYRTPYGTPGPDIFTPYWVSAHQFDMCCGEDGELFKYSAAVKLDNDSAFSTQELWLMHDLNKPDKVTGYSYVGGDSPPSITIRWTRAHDNASGVYKYYIYRAKQGSLSDIYPCIKSYMTPVGTVMEDGRPIYQWTDLGVSRGDRYYYTVVPMDRAGYVRNCYNDYILGRAVSEPEWPPCAYLQDVPRYHSTSGIWVRVDHTMCPLGGSRAIQYQFRMYSVWRDSNGEFHIDTNRYVESGGDGIEADSFYFSTTACSSYTFSARARYAGGQWSHWSFISPSYLLTTKDNAPPNCPDEMYAMSKGDEGIFVRFEQDPRDDCGSGIKGYHLFRIPYDSLTYVLPLGPEDFGSSDPGIVNYRLWDIHAQDDGVYTFSDGPGSHPSPSLVDGVTYMYIICPYDSAGFTSWDPGFCGQNFQYDTATCDLGVGAPRPIMLPAFSTDSIVARFIDTTCCDAESVEIQWTQQSDFSSGMVTTGWLPIRGESSVSGLYRYTNPDDATCASWDWDTLKITIFDLYEARWFIRARFRDKQGNVSDWGLPVLNSQIDNSPPIPVDVIHIQSLADSVDKVNIKITWDPDEVRDQGGVGVDGVNIYRSDAVGNLGTVIATVSRFDSVYIDTEPNYGNNWHDNAYTVAPFDFLSHENAAGEQGYFPVVPGHPQGLQFRPPPPPEIETVFLSPYLDEFTICWNDTGPNPLFNRYMMRHAGAEYWLWEGDPLLAPEVYLGNGNCETLPVEYLIGGRYHYFTIYAMDADSPANQSGWSEVYEYEIPEILTTTFVFHLVSGWNFISLPVIPDNNSKDILFPGNMGVFEWDPVSKSNVPAEYLEPGNAYWLLMPTAMDFLVTGMPLMQVEHTAIGPGWWTVGAPYNTDEGTEYSFTTGWTMLHYYNAVDGKYYSSDELYPGEGYWLLLGDEGDFYCPPDVKKTIPFYIAEPDWSFAVEADGIMLEIASSEHSDYSIDNSDLPIPPLPPSAEPEPCIVDEDGFRYLRSVRPDGEWTLSLPYETTLNWDPDELPPVAVSLVTGGKTIDMHRVSSAVVSGNAKIIAGGILPQTFALKPNRPNPFNASCTIPFDLPEDCRVRLSILDITGRSITTLVDADLPAGEHSIAWDGTDDIGRPVPAGVYLCRMTADVIASEAKQSRVGFNQMRKMLLIK